MFYEKAYVVYDTRVKARTCRRRDRPFIPLLLKIERIYTFLSHHLTWPIYKKR